MKTLQDLSIGETGAIKKINCTGAIKRRMLDMGITTGTKITKTKVSPLGDPIEIQIRDYKLTLRQSTAKEIIIKGEKC